jgi:small subunit ribosomal protein S20
MANIKSAIKRIRTAETKRLQNKTRISRVRTFISKVDEAVKAGDVKAADAAFKAAQPEIQRSKMPKNTVARTLSRLSGKIAKLKGKTPAKKAPGSKAAKKATKKPAAKKTAAKKSA